MPPKKKDGPAKSKQPEKKKETRIHSTPVVTQLTNKYWDIFCLPFMGFGLLFLGIALVAVGAANKIDDLIILGCLLGVGCIVFFVLLYTTVCRPRCQRNMVTSFDLDMANPRPLTGESHSSSALTDYGYYNVSYDHTDDYVVKERVLPSENQLYGDKMRSNMRTPATTKDVTFDCSSPDTPPPPRVALPSGPGNTKDAVFTMEFDKMINKRQEQDIKSLELL